MKTNLENAVIIAVVGFSAVFICLVFFAILISLLNKLDFTLRKRKKQKEELAKQEISIGKGVDTDVIPIIVAAAYATLAEKVVVRTIRFTGDTSSEDSDWARLTRALAISTHNIRRRQDP